MATSSTGQPFVALVVVIFTVQDGALKVLLIRRSAPPAEGWWALPGGVFTGDEPLEAAAARRLVTETGLADVYLEQLYTFSGLDAQRPAIAVTYFALVDSSGVRLRRQREWPPAWHPVVALPELTFNNAAVIEYAVERLGYKLEYTNVAYSLLPECFTLSQLQTVYESILGRRLDKRNFRKWTLARGIVRPTGRTQAEGAHRPAQLYTFTKREPIIL